MASTDTPTEIRLGQVVSALSYALDLTEGQPEGHAVRSAIIGMRIGEALGLSQDDLSALYYALLLKDLGCSSNSAKVCSLFLADDRAIKQGLKTVDWQSLLASAKYVAQNVAPESGIVQQTLRFSQLASKGPNGSRPLFEIRCERGASIAQLLGFPSATAEAIRGLDEHWNGKGHPRGLRGEENSLLARILGLAQTAEVFHHDFGRPAMYRMALERSGQWFDPALVEVLSSFSDDEAFWEQLEAQNFSQAILALEPQEKCIMASEERLDRVAEGFAQVIDAKSPWTFRHSEGVAELAVGTGLRMGFPPERIRTLRRAALLHDIGKLGVSNLVLDKPGKLTEDEWAQVRLHAVHTRDILERIECFQEFALIAAAHHEKLDGSGYPWSLHGSQLTTETRILAVSDIYEALAAERPYRPRLEGHEVLEIMARDAGTALCSDAFSALEDFVVTTQWQPKTVVSA